MAPCVDHIWNIYHPYDPIVYRAEPLVSRCLAQEPAKMVPYHGMSGGVCF